MSENTVVEEKKQTPQTSASLPPQLRFPKYDLQICLEKADILYQAINQYAVKSDEMLSGLGYQPGSGGGATMVASLKYYGIVVETDDKSFVIDGDIIDYYLTKEIKQSVILKYIKNVPINKKIFEKYADVFNLPAPSLIESFLLRDCKYTPQQKNDYINTFNKNLELLKNAANDMGVVSSPPPKSEPSKSTEDSESISTQNNTQPTAKLYNGMNDELGYYNDGYSIGSGKQVRVYWDKCIELDEIDELGEWFGLLIKKMKRISKKEQSTKDIKKNQTSPLISLSIEEGATNCAECADNDNIPNNEAGVAPDE